MQYRGVMRLYFRYVKSRKIPGAIFFAAICLFLTVVAAMALYSVFFASRKIDWQSHIQAVVPVAFLEEALLLAGFAGVKPDARVYRFFRIVGIDLSQFPGILALDLCSVTAIPFLCNLAFSCAFFILMHLGWITVASVAIAELLAYVLSIYGICRQRVRAFKKNPVLSATEPRAPKRRRFRLPILSRSLDMKLFYRAVRTDLTLLACAIGFVCAFVFSVKTVVSLPPKAAFAGCLFGSAFMLVLVNALIQEYMVLINGNFFLLQPLSLGKYFFAALRPVLLCVIPVSLCWLLFLVFRSPQGLLASLSLYLFSPVISFNINVLFGNTLKSGLLSIGALAVMVILCCVNIFLLLLFATVFWGSSYTGASFRFKNYAWRK